MKLSARGRAGQVVLRLEDLDSPRVKPGAAQECCADLRWLGLDWDEGPLFQTQAPSSPAGLWMNISLATAAV